MVKKVEIAKKDSPICIALNESIIKGLEGLNVDDKISVSLNLKITSISRDTWKEKKPLSVQAEVLSGKILDDEVEEEIVEAETVEELEKAVKKIPKEVESN